MTFLLHTTRKKILKKIERTNLFQIIGVILSLTGVLFIITKADIEIVKNCSFIALNNIPQFDDINSNQQQRFITFLDIVYDQNIPMAISAEQNIDKLTSSRLLEKPFKRTISRLYELTSKKHL